MCSASGPMSLRYQLLNIFTALTFSPLMCRPSTSCRERQLTNILARFVQFSVSRPDKSTRSSAKQSRNMLDIFLAFPVRRPETSTVFNDSHSINRLLIEVACEVSRFSSPTISVQFTSRKNRRSALSGLMFPRTSTFVICSLSLYHSGYLVGTVL